MAHCRLWANVRMGSDSSHLLLSCTPPLLPSTTGLTSSQERGRTCRAGAHELIYLAINSHNLYYGTCTAGLPCECRANLFISKIEALYDRPEFSEAT